MKQEKDYISMNCYAIKTGLGVTGVMCQRKNQIFYADC